VGVDRLAQHERAQVSLEASGPNDLAGHAVRQDPLAQVSDDLRVREEHRAQPEVLRSHELRGLLHEVRQIHFFVVDQHVDAGIDMGRRNLVFG